MKRIQATFADIGIAERDEKMAFVIEAIGRTIVSATELTKTEAGKVIDAQEARRATTIVDTTTGEVVPEGALIA